MKRALSLLLALTMVLSLFSVVTGATNGTPTIVSVVALNDTQFKVTTSEPITVGNTGAFALWLVKNGVIDNHYERTNAQFASNGTRLGGTISPGNTATTEFIWTINAGVNATDMIARMTALGYEVYFGLNGASGAKGIDTSRAKDADGNGFVSNIRDNIDSYGVGHDVYAIPLTTGDSLTIEEVKLLNDYRLEISFSKPITAFAGAVLFGVLNTEGTGIYNSDASTTLDDHAVMTYEIKDGKMECWLTADKPGMTEDGKNIAKFMAAVKEKYANNVAGIALLEANMDNLKNTGYLEQVTDADGNALKGTNTMSGRDVCAAAITAMKSDLVIKEVKLLSDYRLEISFSQSITAFAGAVLFGVLNTEGTGIYNSDASTTLDDHAVMTYEIKDGKMECWLTTDKPGMTEDGKNIAKFITAVKDKYTNNVAGIALLEANVDNLKNTGYLEQVIDAEGNALKGTNAMSGRDVSAAPITVTENTDLTIKEVKLLNDYRLEISFSKPISSFAGAVLFGVLNAEKTGLYNSDPSTTLDDHAVMTYEIKDGKMECWLTTDKPGMAEDGKNIIRFIMMVKEKYADHVAGIALLEANVDSLKNTGYLEQAIDANGNALKGTSNTSGRDVCAAAIHADVIPQASVEITSAVAIDDFRFEIRFSKPVKANNKGCVALMAFDENGDMLFEKDEHQGIAGGTLTETSGTDMNDTWTWTINNGLGTATDVIGVWEMQGYTVKLSANGDAGKAQGLFVDNRVTDGTYSCLKANDYNTRTKQNCHTIAVSSVDTSADITIEDVVYCGTSQIVVTFSESVEINKPGFIGLRIVDANGNYVTPIEGTPGSQHNMIWDYVKGSNQTQIVLTFHSRHMLAMLNLTGLYEAYAKDSSHTVFMIGEKTTNVRNGYIDDVVGLDGTGVLKATYAHLIYQELNMQEVVADTREPLTVVSATAINDTDIVIKFSAPVEIGYAPFICLRVVDQQNNQVFGENGTRLQYYGTWKYADDKKDTIIWTSNNWNVKGLLSLTGPWARFNKDGNVTRLCIEELEDKNKEEIDVIGNGFIDNVVDARGMMLTANSIAGSMDTYDGLYVDVVEDYQDPAFFLKSAAWTGDKQITLTFNKPVYFDEKPYMAIRFVNEANVVQYDNGQPLQYQGSWEYGNKEKTVLIWTATYGGSVTAIMNRTAQFANYPDYKIMFCIEEIPADKKVGDLEDGTIHNMYTDDGTKLYSNVVGAGTGWDGVYVPIAVEYTPKPQSPTKKPAEELSKPKEEKVVPTATGPASDMVTMATHTNFTSMLPRVALGVACAVFVGIIAILVTQLPKKKDE